MSQIRIKRGASLSLSVNFTAGGQPFQLAGVTLNAQLRDAEFNLVATLLLTPSATAGQATIFVQDTSAWPEGLLRLDVFALAPGGAQSISDTFGVFIDRAVTQTQPAQAPFNPVTS